MSEETCGHPPIDAAVARVQRSVAVPKARFNSFGKFSYRSLEDIVAALKGPCEEAGLYFTLDDEVLEIAGRFYVASTATACFDDGTAGTKSVTGYAREAEHKSGSDDAQVTGMATSYARKAALCGLFAIDGGGDPDEGQAAPEPRPDGRLDARCRSCGKTYRFDGREQYERFLQHPGCCPSPNWQVC